MSTKELARKAMALPLAERVALAQSLWQSIGGQGSRTIDEDSWVVEESERRDADLTSGKVQGRTHGQVMRAARNALK